MQYLVEHGADVDCRTTAGESPLHIAAQKARIQICEFLLLHGADGTARDDGGYTVMSEATYGGTDRRQVLGILLGNGVPLDVYSAVRLRQVDVVRGFLKDRPGEIREDPLWDDLLVAAVTAECPAMVRLLLSFGAEPNTLGPGNELPLDVACYSSFETPEIVDIVEILLTAGADPILSTREPEIVAFAREERPLIYALMRRFGFGNT